MESAAAVSWVDSCRARDWKSIILFIVWAVCMYMCLFNSWKRHLKIIISKAQIEGVGSAASVTESSLYEVPHRVGSGVDGIKFKRIKFKRVTSPQHPNAVRVCILELYRLATSCPVLGLRRDARRCSSAAGCRWWCWGCVAKLLLFFFITMHGDESWCLLLCYWGRNIPIYIVKVNRPPPSKRVNLAENCTDAFP